MDQLDVKESSEKAAVIPLRRAALIAGGYIACFLLACAAAAVRVALTGGSASQAASGMYGFGDTVFFVAVFGATSLVPTGAALFFLRPYRPFWKVLSALGVALAVAGVAAVVVFIVGRHETDSRLAMWAGVSVLGILVSPLLALAFLVCAVLSPHRPSRFAFIAAAAMEAAVSAYAGAFWFVHVFLHRP
jgi:hypothetical protein